MKSADPSSSPQYVGLCTAPTTLWFLYNKTYNKTNESQLAMRNQVALIVENFLSKSPCFETYTSLVEAISKVMISYYAQREGEIDFCRVDTLRKPSYTVLSSPDRISVNMLCNEQARMLQHNERFYVTWFDFSRILVHLLGKQDAKSIVTTINYIFKGVTEFKKIALYEKLQFNFSGGETFCHSLAECTNLEKLTSIYNVCLKTIFALTDRNKKLHLIFAFTFLLGSNPVILQHKLGEFVGGAFSTELVFQYLLHKNGFKCIRKNYLNLLEVQLLFFYSRGNKASWERPTQLYLEACDNKINLLFHPQLDDEDTNPEAVQTQYFESLLIALEIDPKNWDSKDVAAIKSAVDWAAEKEAFFGYYKLRRLLECKIITLDMLKAMDKVALTEKLDGYISTVFHSDVKFLYREFQSGVVFRSLLPYMGLYLFHELSHSERDKVSGLIIERVPTDLKEKNDLQASMIKTIKNVLTSMDENKIERLTHLAAQVDFLKETLVFLHDEIDQVKSQSMIKKILQIIDVSENDIIEKFFETCVLGKQETITTIQHIVDQANRDNAPNKAFWNSGRAETRAALDKLGVPIKEGRYTYTDVKKIISENIIAEKILRAFQNPSGNSSLVFE